jgi:hypothetical protein
VSQAVPDHRSALESAIARFQKTEGNAFEGVVTPAPELVGPPGRLNGGLHPALRVFAPLARLGFSATRPLNVSLSLRAAIPLEVATPFTGEAHDDARGFVFRSSFGLDGRLLASASSVLADPEGGLGAFRDEHAVCTELPELKTILARGSVPMRIGQKTVQVSMDEAFFEKPSEVGAYRTRDGAFDDASAGVVLDLLGAVAVAAVQKTSLFTTHLELDFHVRSIPRGTALLGLSSVARTEPDTTSGVKPVDVRGTLVPPTRVPVLLADASLETAFVSGFVTVVPVRT